MMKKRVLSFLLATVLLLSLLPAGAIQGTVHAAETVAYAVEGGNIYFDPATGAITDCDETVTTAVIPEKINGISVTSIGDLAFYRCISLTDVNIPASVTSIDEEVFLGCTSLTGIWVNKLNKVYCSDACGVLFSKDKTTLIQYPGGYSGEYTIPDSVTTIGDRAFGACINLTGVTIPDSVTTIRDWAFSACYSLTCVTIPDSVTTIGVGAFSECYSLTGVTIGNSVTTIGEWAFYLCDSLTSVIIPNSVTSIEFCAFGNCPALTSVTIQNPNCSIRDGTDETLGVLGTTVIHGYSGSTAESYAKKYGHSFEILQAFAEVAYAVEGGNIYFNPATGTITGCDATVISAVIPEKINGISVTSIGENAFFNFDNLTSVTIPDSVTTIGEGAFHLCIRLKGIWVDAANTDYSSDEYGVLFNKEKTELIQYPCGGQGSYSIPNSVTSIGRSAFDLCKLTSVTIPDKRDNIKSELFYF